jgi:signal peptidase II
MAGTLGNLYDRLGWHGCVDPLTNESIFAVRDFLLFRLGTYNWPVFNIADVLLVLGASCLVAQSLFGNVNGESTV